LYLQHVLNGIHRNTGDPIGFSKEADKIKQANKCKNDLNTEREVRLTDSTPRQGRPVTWGSGQQEMNSFQGNISSIQREVTSLNSK
jgi:hypothetical protein